jgi:thimet oligopeptidase
MVYKKGLLTVALVAGMLVSSLGAYEYPSAETVADIQKIHLKSVEEIQKKKEMAKKAFHSGINSFSTMSVHKHSSRHVLQTWDELYANMMYNMESLNLLSFVEPDDTLREAYTSAYQELKKEYIQTLSDTKQVYALFSEMNKKEELKQSLHDKEMYYLKQILKEMELEGYHLPDKERNQVKNLKIELSKLSEEFSRNIQEDKSGIKVTKESLEGLKPHFIEQLEVDSDSTYRLTCDYPTYLTVMKSCDNQDTRRDLYRAFQNRASPKNIAVLENIIAKRDQLAHVLGFKSFAHYQLSNEMVKDPAVAEAFLDKLFESSIQKQKEEIKAFKEVLPSLALTENNKLRPWDIAYAQQKYKEVKYDLDQDLIKEYFPLETTIAGLIQIFESFFDLTMTTVPIKDLWHEDVKLLKIADKKTEQVYGYILLDLFPRPNKYSHACHGTIMSGVHLPDGGATTSLSLVIANFPKSTPSRPSLMALSDVKTFFHELGHGIHAVMGRTQFAGTSGTSVKVDFVELPSQMLEEWLDDANILTMVSSHYKNFQHK